MKTFFLCLVAASAQPTAQEEAWMHAPLHLVEELKVRHLRKPHHARSALISDKGKVIEGTRTSKIVGEIGTAEQALEKELQGHPEILLKEEHLLHQASDMALRAGHYHKQEALLRSKMAKSNTKTLNLSQHKAAQGTQLKSLERQAEVLIADGVSILHATKDLKVNVVEAIGESNPAAAAKVEKLLDLAGRDQKNIIQGENKLVHSMDHVLTDEKHQHSKLRTDKNELRHDAATEHALAHAGQEVLQGAENVKTEVGKLLGQTDAAQVNKLMSQVESIQQNVIRTDNNAAQIDHHLLDNIKIPHPHTVHINKEALAQESAQTKVANAAMLARFAKQERTMQSMVKKREGMVAESRHLLAETDRAQAALEEQLGGTEAGTAIAEILGKAQSEERKAAEGTRKQVLLAKTEVSTVKDLVKQLKSIA